jgi:enoyl-CoA hydratase/carnithine racemase
VGYQLAKELMFTDHRWDAKGARELGLVNNIVPSNKVMDEAMAMAKKKSPLIHPSASSRPSARSPNRWKSV